MYDTDQAVFSFPSVTKYNSLHLKQNGLNKTERAVTMKIAVVGSMQAAEHMIDAA